MPRTRRLVSRRAIVVSGSSAVGAVAGAALSRVPTAGREPGPPAIASPGATPFDDAPKIAIEARGLRFLPSTISIPAHTPVRIVLTNRSRVHHDLVIPGLGRRTPRIGPDESSELLIRAEPGTYDFHCSIQSHHQAGMGGTITVAQGTSTGVRERPRRGG